MNPSENDPIPARIHTQGHLLRVDVMTTEVVASFKGAGLDSILLKGPSIARWLYDDHIERPYTDSDLLVSPDNLDRARKNLEAQGFSKSNVDIAFDQTPAGENWTNPDKGAIDLHHRLSGLGVGPQTQWSVLVMRTEPMQLAGRPIPILQADARLLHVALHVAHHGPGIPRPLEDLRRAIERVDIDVWRKTVELAQQLDAIPALIAGLRVLPEGTALAQELRLPDRTTTEVALRSGATPPLALGFNWMGKLPGLHRKVGFLIAKAFPPPEFIRKVDARARGGAWNLTRGYARRVWWLIKNTPRGLKAYLDARAAERRTKRNF